MNCFGENHPSWKGGVQTPINDCVHLWDGIGKRKRRPRAIYEEHNGAIPENFVIIHLDRNKHNDEHSNLKAVSRSENMMLNSRRTKNDTNV